LDNIVVCIRASFRSPGYRRARSAFVARDEKGFDRDFGKAELPLVCEPGQPAPGEAVQPARCNFSAGPSTTSEHIARKKLPRLAKPRERTAARVVSDTAGRRNARRTEMEARIPSWLPVAAAEMDKPYTLASWDPEMVNLDGSHGCVYLNRENAAVVSLVEEMARDYSVTREDVASWGPGRARRLGNAGQSLVAKVVYVQSVLRRDVERTTLRNEYLSDVALTTAGLGMIWEQQALQPKLGGILGRRKAS
jgi:hypothetical protein